MPERRHAKPNASRRPASSNAAHRRPASNAARRRAVWLPLAAAVILFASGLAFLFNSFATAARPENTGNAPVAISAAAPSPDNGTAAPGLVPATAAVPPQYADTGSETPAAAIIVKSTTNRGETDIGDYWIGEDFAAGFRALGLNADTDYRGEYRRPHTPEPQINLYMRGYTDFTPPFPPGCNVLYAYYPMAYAGASAALPAKAALNRRPPQPENANLDDDWQNFDLIAVASPSYAEELNRAGIKAIYVPQFTNPEKFHPAPDPALAADILFVGSNWHDRTSLRYALEAGFNVAVYGYNWQGIVPPEMYKAPYIANTELNRYYSSAKIVLNDHRPDMKDFGFINNRIYDATAADALVISDYMPEIEAAYGDAVPMYKNKEELAALLNYYLTHEDERRALAEKARRITLEKFTHTAAAQTVLNAARAACPDSLPAAKLP